MSSNHRGLKKGDILFIAFLLLLLVTGGFLIRNVAVNLQKSEHFEFALQQDLNRWEKEFQDLLSSLRWFGGSSRPRTSTSPPPAPPAASKADPSSQTIAVTSIRFFESDQTAPASRQRSYQQKFPLNSRIIYTEIGYKNKFYQQKDAEIPVRVEFWNSKGQKVNSVQGVTRPKKEWATVLFIIRWPRPDTGGWNPDQYTVKIHMDNMLVGESRFEIF